MWVYICIGVGGGLGSVLRFMITTQMSSRFGNDFPFGTLLVNIIGSFLIGWFFYSSSTSGRIDLSENLKHLVLAGFCGGFTTFSSFSLQTLVLLRESAWLRAGGYITGSFFLCLFFVWLGYRTAYLRS